LVLSSLFVHVFIVVHPPQVSLPEGTIRLLCQVSREVFMKEDMLLEVEAPLNIFGDIHGQYDDLLRHFDMLGYPPDICCLFMGDYVDRLVTL